MADERDLLEDEDEGEGATDDTAEGVSSGDGDPKSSDKRIRDLQSKADRETARANRAEKQLKAVLEASLPEDAGAGKPPGGGDVANDALLDMARMFAFQQQPKLAEYGISASDLTGSTPSDIAQSAADTVARLEKIETQARNKVLAENGLAPEIEQGAPPAPPRDYSKMPKEDFQKLMDAALKGN